jgi:hypothetical protein
MLTSVSTPPGLSLPFSVEAAIFKPGASEYLPLSTPGVGETPVNNYEQLSLQYKQLCLQYDSEVPHLRHQLMELSSKYRELMSQFVELDDKFAELDDWRLKTVGLVHDIRVEHRTLRRTVGEEPFVTPQPLFVEHEAVAIPERHSRSRSDSPELNIDTDIVVRKGCSECEGPDGKKTKNSSMRADWKVKHFSGKLRGAAGRPVVSSPFAMCGLQEIRLMVTPEWGGKSGPRSRKEKEQFSKMVTDGPLRARLSVKIPNACPSVLRYFLRVGKTVTGPHEFDFSNTAIHDCGSFDGNWLLEMDKDGSISVGMELLAPPGEADDNTLNVQVGEVESAQDDPGMPPGLFVCTEDFLEGV